MPAQPLDDATLKELVADATAAPSMHNAQPWRFGFRRSSRTLTLRAEFDREMPEADPSTRGLHVGCGAALLNLRVSAEHRGLDAVTTLVPVPADPSVVAAVRLGERPGAPENPAAAALAALHPAIPQRHTSRFPFDDRAIPDDLRAHLTEAAHDEGSDFAFLPPKHLERVLVVIRDAEGFDLSDPAREAEQRYWTRDTKVEAPVDGVPDHAFGPTDASGRALNRDFAGTDIVPGRAHVPFEGRPQLALLRTARDRPADWLRAGQALERVLLTAVLHGLVASFATQPLEWPEIRHLLRDPALGTGHPQMIVRLGYGPDGPRTPRRPVAEVLTVEP
ncbi:nitroreductase family protein [Streptomyces sp. NBC_01591]|uniref:Acg family FMN-binding oxidoreductase n=1 Tax=Streptomyces sp. NBC_01591 TaxID=2975888 RepID=UPI002DD79E1F|nr:nitroreductase family protein [Streptomyces sp. NBC_01591]WSD72734.1 nitroreductase family protein [Streptomyces sp. NBC_01591]